MVYTVKRGDSLSKIAKANRVTLAKLLEANPGYKSNPGRINVGAHIEIPGVRSRLPTTPRRTATRSTKPSEKDKAGEREAGTDSSGQGDATYTVRKGDSLSKIAKAQGVTLAKLLEANPEYRSNPGRISVGARIEIPRVRSQAPAAQSSTSSTITNRTVTEHPTLGKLSEKYETGGRGPGTVSSLVGGMPAECPMAHTR